MISFIRTNLRLLIATIIMLVEFCCSLAYLFTQSEALSYICRALSYVLAGFVLSLMCELVEGKEDD